MRAHSGRRWFILACWLGLVSPAVAAEPTPATPPKAASPARPPETADEYIARAFRRVDTWQWSEALADANEALRLEPPSARAILARGAANVGVNPAAALRDLAEAEKRGEKSARLYCEQGLAYCALKRYDKALEAADRALKVDAKEPRAYGLRGQAIAATKGLSAAMPDLNKAVDLDPTSAYGWGVRGEVIADWDVNLGPPPPDIARLKQLNPHVPDGNLSAGMAVPHLRRAIELDPDNPRYHYDRGVAYDRVLAHANAMRDLDRAIALNPDFFLAYFQRMQLKVTFRDFKGGDADAVQMIRIEPSNYAGHHAHGWYLIMTGNNEEGLKEINLAIQLDPEHAVKDYIARANVRLDQGNPSETVADATKALEINPRQSDAHHLRGLAFMRLHEWKKAIADFDVMIRVAPKVVDHWTWRAEAKMRMKDYKGAMADDDEALKASPHYPAALFQRGCCRMELKDFDAAAADFRDALAHGIDRHKFEGDAPGDAAAHRHLGEVFRRQHKSEEAVAEFDRALSIYSRDTFTLVLRGGAKHELHDYPGAVEDFTRAIEIQPEHYGAYSERGFSKYELKDYPGAIADFDAALKIRPSCASAYAGRGIVKLAMDDCEGALADLNVAAHQARAAAGATTADLADSARTPVPAGVAEETSAGDANNPFGYLAGNEHVAGAAAPAEPDRGLLSDIYHNRGLAYYKMAQFAKAIKEYDQAFDIWPPTEKGLMTRSNAKGCLGDWPGLLADAKQALAINPKCEWARYDLAVSASLGGDFAGALTILNQTVQDYPAAGAPRLYRAVLLDALGEWKLALADYREILKDTGDGNTWNADQAALAIWTIRGLREERVGADEDLRKHFDGRKPDLKVNWYGRLAAFLLDRQADEAALIGDAQSVEPPSERLWRQASVYSYISVRRRAAGDESGAVEMMKKAAATNAVTELQWYESELRLRIASGKIPSPRQPEAGRWQDNLPRPPENASDR